MKAVLTVFGWIIRFILFLTFSLVTSILEALAFVTKWLRDVSRPNS